MTTSACPGEKIQLLQIGRLTPEGEQRLHKEYAVTPLFEQTNQEQFLMEDGGRFKALVTSGGVEVSAGLIEMLPSLQVIATRSVGFDHIDIETAQNRGIVVSNTPDVLTDCVADYAFGTVIALARQFLQADRFVREGKWLKGHFPLTTRVSGKRLGIVGMGRIGRAIAKRADGFDMEVRYFSRRPLSHSSYTYESSLLDLAKWADFLILCVPGGPGTRNLVSADVMDALGQQGYLINISRGSVVDQDALIRALQKRKIGGAALDVYAEEPHVPQALCDLDTTILLPHIASSTKETFAAMEDLLFQNLQNFFTTGQLVSPVV